MKMAKRKENENNFTHGKYLIIKQGKGNEAPNEEIEVKIKSFIKVRAEMTGVAPTEAEIKAKRKKIKKEMEDKTSF